MNKAGPTNITLSAIAGIYILAQVIIVPALPDLGLIFSSDYRTIQLSVSAFSIGAAIVNIIAGPLSDRFGRRPIALGFFILFINISWSFLWIIGILLGGLHMIWQIIKLDLDSPSRALILFKSNRDLGLIISLFAFLDLYFRS